MRAVLICLLMFSIVARAEDWTTTDGKTYQDIKVLSHDDGFVTVMDSDGGATIPLRLLTPDLQARFGYNAQKAAAREAAVAAQDQADQAAMATQRAAAAQQAEEAQEAAAHAVPPGSFSPLIPSSPFDGGLVQNGDFSRGNTGWEGDGKTPREFAMGDPRPMAEPLTCRGLIVQLNPQSWTKIYQSFPTPEGTQFSIAITFRVAPDLAPSKNLPDYVEIGKHLGIDGFDKFGALSGRIGDFYGTVGDPTSSTMAMEIFAPKLGSNEVQTYEHTYPALPVTVNKTVALAFPPGSGIVDILTVKVTSK